MVGLAAIISTFSAFLKSPVGTGAFIVLIVGIVVSISYMILRMFYWTNWANIVINISMGEAIELFNYYNLKRLEIPFTEKAPNTAIIQIAINGIIDVALDKDKVSWYDRLALRHAPISSKKLRKVIRGEKDKKENETEKQLIFHKDKS
jgi:hypothetical protein